MGQSKSLLLKLSIALALGITLPAASLWAADSAGEPGRSSGKPKPAEERLFR